MENDFNFFSIQFHTKLKFIRSFVHSFIRSFAHSFIRSFAHSFVRSFVHSLTRSFVRSFVRSLTHSLIRLFIIVYHFLYKIMPPKLKIKAPSVMISETPAASATPSCPSCPSAPSSSIPSCSQFLSSLSPLEQRVCAIAESHLESSFDLSRSSGFIAWKAKNT